MRIAALECPSALILYGSNQQMIFTRQAPPSGFYVYVYIREKDGFSSKGTPYYIGKGNGPRAWVKHGTLGVPTNPDCIHIVECDMLESNAFLLEQALISEYGRID